MPIQLFQVLITFTGRFSSLHYSIICSQNNVVEFLIIERSRDVNALGFNRNEASRAVASRFGHAEAAHIILEYGANTKIRDKYDRNSLVRGRRACASENGHVDVVQVLLGYGANVMALDSTGTAKSNIYMPTS